MKVSVGGDFRANGFKRCFGDLKPASVLLLKKGWVIGVIGVIIGRRPSKLVALEIKRTLVSFVVTVGMEE